MKRRIPFIEQHQKTECGLCCIAMVSSYFDHEITLQELRDMKETGRDGTTFKQLIDLFENMGFECKSFKYPKEKHVLQSIYLPAIALWKKQHFIVIEKIKNDRVYILDPELGRLRYSYDEFLSGFSNYLISITNSDKVEILRSKESYKKIYQMFFQSWLYFLPLLFFTLASYAVTFLFPLFIQKVINSSQSQISLISMLLYIISFLVIYLLVKLFQKLFSIRLTTEVDSTLNRSVLSKLFRLPYKFYSTHSRGDLVYSINNLVRIRELFANQFLLGILDIGMSLCVLIYLLILNPILCGISLILLIVNFFLLMITNSSIEQKNKALIRSQNDVQNKQIEIIYSMLGIKMEGFEEQIQSQWDEKFSKYIYRYKDNGYFVSVVSTIFETFSFTSPFIILLFSMHLSGLGLGNFGKLFSIYSLSTILFGKVNSIFNTFVSFYNSKPYLSRVLEIIEQDEEKLGYMIHELEGNIRFEDVTFSYTKDSKVILNSLNLTIKKGEKVAIVGGSGSGKSTLSKLLVGLYEPNCGSIYYGNIDFRILNKKMVRQQIGIVPQDMTLFNKTIKENIVGDMNIDDSQIMEACKLVNIHDEIKKMPMGYQTLVSEMGMNLSGGQRQRLILARALVKKPKIILLDEATSYLDNLNEKSIMDNLKKRGITTIIIAHRLSTIIDSDKIFVLEDGCILEEGNHKELMLNSKGLYRRQYEIGA